MWGGSDEEMSEDLIKMSSKVEQHGSELRGRIQTRVDTPLSLGTQTPYSASRLCLPGFLL
jgi:hypothetical protein